MLVGQSWGNQWEYWDKFNTSGDGSYNVVDHQVMFDGPTKTIWILEDVTELDVKTYLYSDWKEWSIMYDHTKYLQAFETEGGKPISQSERLGDTYFLINDWVIRQRNASTPVNVIGNLYAYDLNDEVKDPYGFDPDGGKSITSKTSLLVSTVVEYHEVPIEVPIEVDYDGLAAAVWSAMKANHIDAGTMGEQMSSIPTTQQIVDGVWDEQTSSHTIAGSTGEAVAAGGGSGTPAAIADAVWDKSTSENTAIGTRGAEQTLTYEEAKRSRQMQTNKVAISRIGSGTGQVDTINVYDDDGTTLLYTITVTGEDCDNRNVTYSKPY